MTLNLMYYNITILYQKIQENGNADDLCRQAWQEEARDDDDPIATTEEIAVRYHLDFFNIKTGC